MLAVVLFHFFFYCCVKHLSQTLVQVCVLEQQILHVLCILISLCGKIWPSCEKPAWATNVWFSVKWATLHPNNLTQSSFVVRIGHCSHWTRLSCSWCLAMFHNLLKMNLAFTRRVCDSSGDVSSSTLVSSAPLCFSLFLVVLNSWRSLIWHSRCETESTLVSDSVRCWPSLASLSVVVQ